MTRRRAVRPIFAILFGLVVALVGSTLSRDALASPPVGGSCTCTAGCQLFPSLCNTGNGCNAGYAPVCGVQLGGVCTKGEVCDGTCNCNKIPDAGSSSGGGSSSSSSSSSSGGADSGNDGAAIESGAPESGAEESGLPETGTPETSAPESSVPETSTPEASAPETSAPETGPIDASDEIVVPVDAALFSDAALPPPAPEAGSCMCPSGTACTGCPGTQNVCAPACGTGEFPCPGGGTCTQGFCVPTCCVAGCSSSLVCNPVSGDCESSDGGGFNNPGEGGPIGAGSDAALADEGGSGEAGTGPGPDHTSGCSCLVVDDGTSGALGAGLSALFGTLLLARRRRHS